jgi:hypothetical protein
MCADEARNVAKSLTHPNAKREMILVAEYFAMLAKQVQRKRSANSSYVCSPPSAGERLKTCKAHDVRFCIHLATVGHWRGSVSTEGYGNPSGRRSD